MMLALYLAITLVVMVLQLGYLTFQAYRIGPPMYFSKKDQPETGFSLYHWSGLFFGVIAVVSFLRHQLFQLSITAGFALGGLVFVVADHASRLGGKKRKVPTLDELVAEADRVASRRRVVPLDLLSAIQTWRQGKRRLLAGKWITLQLVTIDVLSPMGEVVESIEWVERDCAIVDRILQISAEQSDLYCHVRAHFGDGAGNRSFEDFAFLRIPPCTPDSNESAGLEYARKGEPS